jgi:hypothetical protein
MSLQRHIYFLIRKRIKDRYKTENRFNKISGKNIHPQSCHDLFVNFRFIFSFLSAMLKVESNFRNKEKATQSAKLDKSTVDGNLLTGTSSSNFFLFRNRGFWCKFHFLLILRQIHTKFPFIKTKCS